jgi:membrane-associated phospholipid phosphatase
VAAAGPSRPRRVGVALSALVGSYLVARSGRGQALEARLGAALLRPRGDRVDRAVAAGTDLGSVYGAAGMATALAAVGRRRLARDVGGAALVAWTAAQVTKPLFGRARPYELDAAARLVAVPAGSSWPSGHAALAAAMASVVARDLTPRARAGVAATVALVGLSRAYVGVHHPTDVIGGIGLGVLAATVWEGSDAVALRRVSSR